MNIWPIPNLKIGIDIIEIDQKNKDDWYNGDDWYGDKKWILPQDIELPKGWSNPWPELPDVDQPHENGINFSNIDLSIPRKHCDERSILGYYYAWHIIGISFFNKHGRCPNNGAELKSYNDSLPIENRYGIHICCDSIENYIKKFDTSGFTNDIEVENYLEYCTFLTMIYVIAHEWGHYRSEALSFQIGNLMKGVTGVSNSSQAPSFLSYFSFKKKYPQSNFEEVFAEWSSLKFGIFNYYMKDLAFAKKMTNWPKLEATVQYMLLNRIGTVNRSRPYSDIRHWIDFNELTEDMILKRISQNHKSVNRSVNDNVKIVNVKSYKRGRIIDMLMHNQIQFSANRQFNGLIKSAPLSFPLEPDSYFYHFGEDECQKMDQPGNSTNKFLHLSRPNYSNSFKSNNSRISKIIKQLKGRSTNAILPIPIFDEILPLDPVYFHTSGI